MKSASILILVCLIGVVTVGFAGLVQQSATEAPAGFDTPTLAQNPGSQSNSNGLAEQPRLQPRR